MHALQWFHDRQCFCFCLPSSIYWPAYCSACWIICASTIHPQPVLVINVDTPKPRYLFHLIKVLIWTRIILTLRVCYQYVVTRYKPTIPSTHIWTTQNTALPKWKTIQLYNQCTMCINMPTCVYTHGIRMARSFEPLHCRPPPPHWLRHS